MGDGVLVYFGYPRAHEDDAEQAVRAGLALVDAVGRLQAPEPLRARVGIGTGQVVVGDLITSGEGQEHGVAVVLLIGPAIWCWSRGTRPDDQGGVGSVHPGEGHRAIG